jgi:hypothetical protein
MTLQPSLRTALLVGIALTLGGAGFSLLLPNAPNYVFLPGMMIVYVASGGVHGFSSGVYLPGLTAWYALGGLLNVIIYSVITFMVLRLPNRRKDKDSL